MAEQPPLNRFYVASYAANDRDFPIVAIRLDPRVAGYRVPEDLSPHPDSKRYPNHVFTGSEPSDGDERVTHIYEILPSPWVPFTRYDDDLGPIQGRRRFVKNEGQQASLTSSTKISYEGREGSAIVSNEIEETWSIAVDEDGNSLFPIKTRNFYEPLRGAVQETRQLFVPTGDEEATLKNVDGVITQTSYDVYNEYLSIKIVETYSVSGPQLVGQNTNEARQTATVTTQIKGAANYVAPEPSAKKTVEVSRENVEAVVERITEVPNVFNEKTVLLTKPDVIPEKFRTKIPTIRTEEVIEQDKAEPSDLEDNEYSKSEKRLTEFTVAKSTITRSSDGLNKVYGSQLEETYGFSTPYEEYISDTIPEEDNIDAEGLDDVNYAITKWDTSKMDATLGSYHAKIPITTNLNIPRILSGIGVNFEQSQDISQASMTSSASGVFRSMDQGDEGTASVTLSLIPQVSISYIDIDGSNIPATQHIFFAKQEDLQDVATIRTRVGAAQSWPIFRTTSFSGTIYGRSAKKSLTGTIARGLQITRIDGKDLVGSVSSSSQKTSESSATHGVSFSVSNCITPSRYVPVAGSHFGNASGGKLEYQAVPIFLEGIKIGELPAVSSNLSVTNNLKISGGFTIPASDPPYLPKGVCLVGHTAEPYKFGWFLIRAITVDASILTKTP